MPVTAADLNIKSIPYKVINRSIYTNGGRLEFTTVSLPYVSILEKK